MSIRRTVRTCEQGHVHFWVSAATLYCCMQSFPNNALAALNSKIQADAEQARQSAAAAAAAAEATAAEPVNTTSTTTAVTGPVADIPFSPAPREHSVQPASVPNTTSPVGPV